MKYRTKKWSLVLVVAVVVSVALAGMVLGLARADSDDDDDSNRRGFTTFIMAKRIEFLDNEVIRIDTFVAGTFGGVSVRLGVPIAELDRKISFSSFLVNIDCSGGSPRIQLAVDTDGDGISNGNAFG